MLIMVGFGFCGVNSGYDYVKRLCPLIFSIANICSTNYCITCLVTLSSSYFHTTRTILGLEIVLTNIELNLTNQHTWALQVILNYRQRQIMSTTLVHFIHKTTNIYSPFKARSLQSPSREQSEWTTT